MKKTIRIKVLFYVIIFFVYVISINQLSVYANEVESRDGQVVSDSVSSSNSNTNSTLDSDSKMFDGIDNSLVDHISDSMSSNESGISNNLNHDLSVFSNSDVSSIDTTSIKETIASADKTKILVVPDPVGGKEYKEYLANESGFKNALFDLYTNGGMQQFTLYIGTNVSLSAAVTANTIPNKVDATNVTFASLKNKVNKLVITGNSDDPITQDQTVPAGSKTLTFNQNNFFGSSIVLRNLNYGASNFYMNGNNLDLNGGSRGNGVSIYGGTDSGDISGDPIITVTTTGSGTWNFYGGNNGGGTLTGNPTILINNTSGGVNTLTGGANVGTVNGNTEVTISQLNGTLSNYYGGGVGSSTSKTANVTGNVQTVIKNTSSSFRQNVYYGGVLYGNITGSISNNISGTGGWSSIGSSYIGGSGYGNIGVDSGKQAIETTIDASKYTSYGPSIVGANRYAGTVTGNITNTITAGTSPSQGGVGNFDGGGGPDASKLTKNGIGAANETTYDAYTPDQRTDLAFKSAQYKIIGNIDSHLVSGSFGNYQAWRTTAAGVGGFVQGNATIKVGTQNTSKTVGGEGFVYSGNKRADNTIFYSSKRNTLADERDFDIAGGGYVVGRDVWCIYIRGNTTTEIDNALARRTYGGLFSGVVEGNTSNILNTGIVDTCEGTGYEGGRVYGDGHATVNNGQVDWFLTGGGWNDKKCIGNVGVTVNDGVINASMGASYGAFSDHTVTGNSDNRIYGGDFSGVPNQGNNGFSGGITNTGSLLGNAHLLIDLRGYHGEFKLPTGTSISGGRPYGANTNLGSSTDNTITLDIFTKPGSDVLNGADIYGDGGTAAANTKSGKIQMNIQATGSNIGNLYATQYSNINNNQILRDVTANVQGSASIATLSGGSDSDNFTNTIANNSTNKVKYNFGTNIDGTSQYQSDPINVTKGIVNYSELNITNGIELMAASGDIKNGKSSTALNHSATYNNFGDIHLSKSGSLGLKDSARIISAGKIIVEDSAKLETPPGKGKVNISDFEVVDPSKDSLTWVKNDIGTTNLVDSIGTWFGNNKAYQVLTINPTITNAQKITPAIFNGIEKATGKTFIGDNDVTNKDNGYGIAIPGSIIDYEVESPGISQGAGSIFHDVSQVKKNNEPLKIAAFGTETANTRVQKGKLVIPTSSNISPTLSFEPETTKTGSWLYNASITSTKINEPIQNIVEQKDSNTVNWKTPDINYSYQIKVKYSNKAELNAKNVIITEQDAAKLKSKQQVLDLMGASGRPFFSNSIDDDLLKTIQRPLDQNEVSKKYAINYQSGTTENMQNSSANLVVVKNGSVISKDKNFAVYAQDTNLKLSEANSFNTQSDLNKFTKAQVIFSDNRDNIDPQLSNDVFLSIKNTTENELQKNVATTYSYIQAGETINKTVNVSITGTLRLKEYPSNIDFGTQKIATTIQTYWPKITGDLIVKDTRGTESSPWQLTVSEMTPLTSDSMTLDGVLSYQSSNGSEPEILSKSAVIIENHTNVGDGEFNISQGWGQKNEKVIKATIPVEKQKIGTYKGTLSWSLVSAPGNP
ncbi:hypothetical protein ACQKTA_07155 [Enterococcus sp. 22-H-5-01]|uniref:hypothetical protein n=1 Tax=Enterococcus sp. 22-H-5-01 TaxID=3418555 RepID=UPI003D0352A3